MTISAAMAPEVKNELTLTRKVIERIPESKFDWKPHEKSTSLLKLGTHVSELFSFGQKILVSTEYDVGGGRPKPEGFTRTSELVDFLDKNGNGFLTSLEGATDEQLLQMWELRFGDKLLFKLPRVGALRTVILNHLVHHRGQLTVYLRLLDVPVPSIYGPSADEPV